MRPTIASILLLALSCASGPEVAFNRTGGQSEIAWRHLQQVEDTLPHGAAAVALTSHAALAQAWTEHGFEAAPPEIDFDHRFVLLLAQPDDACPDELVGLEVVDGRLQAEWLPPPGGCIEPLVFRLHAVDVHRGHVPASFTVAIPAPYAEGAEPTEIQLRDYSGRAPPPPQPSQAMTDGELDAVFEGHAVDRCTREDQTVPHAEVDGPLSEQPEVAQAQRDRASFGVPSDEATTRRVMDSAQRNDEYGFPLLRSELAVERDAEELLRRVTGWLRDQGLRAERDFVPVLDRRGVIRPHVRVATGRVEQLQAQLDREFGARAVVVDRNRYDLAAVEQAQRDLGAFMGGGTAPGAIVWTTGIPGPVQIGMVDPTRDALDAVAATVDPDLVCVEPQLSGVQTGRAG